MSSKGKPSHKCTACGRRTYARIMHLPHLDKRCPTCRKRGYFPKALHELETGE